VHRAITSKIHTEMVYGTKMLHLKNGEYESGWVKPTSKCTSMKFPPTTYLILT